MTIVLVLLLVLVVLVVYIFFAPFYIEVDSNQNLYRFRFHKVMHLVLKTQDDLALELFLLGWKREYKLNTYTSDKKKAVKKAVKIKNSSGIPSPIRIKRLLKSFRFTMCYVRIDLEDIQLNGMLYPVLAWLSWYSKSDMQISFTGPNVIIVEIKNNLARMSWAWFGSK